MTNTSRPVSDDSHNPARPTTSTPTPVRSEQPEANHGGTVREAIRQQSTAAIPIDQPIAERLAIAERILSTYGYERQPDNSYKQTPEGRRADVDALRLDSYQYRSLLRAELEGQAMARPIGSGLDRFREETESALDALGEKFGIVDLTGNNYEVLEAVEDALLEAISVPDYVKQDAEEQAEDEGTEAGVA